MNNLASICAVVLGLVVFNTQSIAAESGLRAGQDSLSHLLDDISVPVPHITPRPDSVNGITRPLMSLNGVWLFCPDDPSGFQSLGSSDVDRWSLCSVPGEWKMQGYSVPKNHFAAYVKSFDVPLDWRGSTVMLRFDGVQSECRVWLNGKEVGGHEGGFTIFDFNISDFVHHGTNVLAVAVRNESIADVLASATQYAAYQIGGITRKVTIFALPKLHFGEQGLTTSFDKEWVNGRLAVDFEIANSTPNHPVDCQVQFELLDPNGGMVKLRPSSLSLGMLPADTISHYRFSVNVGRPRKWDPEHPNLYTLRSILRRKGRMIETLSERFGFRTVEVKGNRLFVNNSPVKLRGVNRHETHPTMGRSLSTELWRKDAELFREANINYIRTSHYPPAEEFLDACDELGLFVECEAPLCWVQHGANDIWKEWDSRDVRLYPYLLRANLENVKGNRQHPSIIIWSLANESYWSPLFAKVLDHVRGLDPTRATSFHDQCWGDYNNGGSKADIAVYHYPGEDGPAKCDSGTRPTLFGEYAHLQTYNRRENVTDPGIRDKWGAPFHRMWDLIWDHESCLGGAIWAGIDDIFALPDGTVCGYGPWGLIDGWRRKKPEYWHVRKTYSPIRVSNSRSPLRWGNGFLEVPVENRYDFTNLSEVRITWNSGDEKGVTSGRIPPHGKGTIRIPVSKRPADGDSLLLSFTDPRGFECDEIMVTVGLPRPAMTETVSLPKSPLHLERTATQFVVSGNGLHCGIDRKTGEINILSLENHSVLSGGPALMILPLWREQCLPDFRPDVAPLDSCCTVMSVDSVYAADSGGSVAITVAVRYREAHGSCTLRFDSPERLTASYEFTVQQDVNPRQWGLVLFASRAVDRLQWVRRGEWSIYPDDHIGRLEGEAFAAPRERGDGMALRVRPSGSWSTDANEMGTADFRSTKSDVITASLLDRSGFGLSVAPSSAHSIRAFVDGNRIGLLLARFDTGGGENFFEPHFAAERRPLKAGEVIHDEIDIRLLMP